MDAKEAKTKGDSAITWKSREVKAKKAAKLAVHAGAHFVPLLGNVFSVSMALKAARGRRTSTRRRSGGESASAW